MNAPADAMELASDRAADGLLGLAERGLVPDVLLRAGIRRMCAGRLQDEYAADPESAARRNAGLISELRASPVAIHTDAANRQHYELPPGFFTRCLGPRLKYSGCFYPTGNETLAQAEEAMLALYGERARLADGQDILELGCGWGSLSLFMAERFPAAKIVAVSNSTPQRAHIEAEARVRGLGNLSVVTADMNVFDAKGTFDRIVSVEMFEHMSNWRMLLERVRRWLSPEGRLFLHVFSHRSHSYRFDHGDRADWIAQHFFTGGVMPSHDLARQFPDLFEVVADWRWSGEHYARTAEAWLVNYDRNAETIRPILAQVYGDQALLWGRRWRLFFLATSGLFGHRGGTEWGVSHYLMSPAGESPC